MNLGKLLKELLFGVRVSSKTKSLINQSIKKADQVLKTGDENAKKSLIVEMDAVLGKSLRDLYGKNSVAENLRKAKSRFNSVTYQKAWDAHKIRNKIAHEPGYSFSDKDLRDSILNFNQVLKSFN